MSDLDKLFKKKLEHRSFEFKDAYWEAAEQLIEKEEGKRRKFGWWWIGLFLVFVLSAGGIYYIQTNTEAVDKTPISASMSTQQLATSSEKDNSASRPLNTTKTANENLNITQENTTTTSNINESDLSSIRSEQFIEPASAEPAIAKVNDSENISATQSRAASEAIISEYKIKPQAIDNTSLSNSPVAIEESLAADSEQEVKVSVQSYEKASATTTDPLTPDSKSKETVNVTALELLDTRDLLGIEKEERPEEDLELIVNTLKPKRLRLSLDIATMFNVTTDFKGFSGDALGLAVNYRLKNRWSIQSGLRYAIRAPQNFSDLQKSAESSGDIESFDQQAGAFISTTNYYNFGLIQVNEITEVKNFHFIELPVALQWQANRHALGLGVQLNYLVGVRGSQSLETSQASLASSTNPDNSETLVPGSTTKSWLDRDLYKKWSPEIFFNYGFSLSPRWNIYTGVQYRLSGGQISSDDILQDNSSTFGGARGTSMFAKNSLYFRLGMRYTIGK